MEQTNQMESALLTIAQVAEQLNCSQRHVRRMSETRRMPGPLHLGSHLLRWRCDEVRSWISRGCPDCRKGWKGDERE